jgi:hypothetical protein
VGFGAETKSITIAKLAPSKDRKIKRTSFALRFARKRRDQKCDALYLDVILALPQAACVGDEYVPAAKRFLPGVVMRSLP